MTASVKPIPDGYHSVTPYLVVRDAARAIEFYKRAFGAKDSGWIIPGHGGILDRLDSLLFPMVFVYYYTAFPRG